jgi:Tfp pilus assembly protein PilN
LQGLLSARKQFDFNETQNRGVIIVLLALLLGGAYFALGYFGTRYTDKTAQMRAEMSAYQEVVDVKNAIRDKSVQLASIRELLDSAEVSSFVKSAFFNAVGASLNESVFLTSLTLNEDGTVSIAGKAAGRADLTYFIYNLKKTGYFTDVALSTINEEKQQDEEAAVAYDFSATARIKEVEHLG